MARRKTQLRKALSEEIKNISEGKGKSKYEGDAPDFGKKDKDDDDDDDEVDEEFGKDKDDDDDDDEVDETVVAKDSGTLETDNNPKKAKKLKTSKSAASSKIDKIKVKEAIIKKYEEIETEINSDISKDIGEMFSKESGLSEDFVKKASLIFETAVKLKVENGVAKLEELADQEIEHQVEEMKTEMIESMNGYLHSAVKEYMKENELAIETGARHDISEGLISEMKEVFEAHNVMIPDGKEDLLDSLYQENEKLSSKLDSIINERIEDEKELTYYRKGCVLETVSENLTDTEKEKIVKLSETVDYENDDDFLEKIVVLKESFLGKKTIIEDKEIEVSKGTNQTIVESNGNESVSNDPMIASIVKKISQQEASTK